MNDPRDNWEEVLPVVSVTNVDRSEVPLTAAGREMANEASKMWLQPNRLAGANAMESATAPIRAAILRIEAEAIAHRNAELAALRTALDDILDVLGPVRPTCEGCSVEMEEALGIARAAIDALGVSRGALSHCATCAECDCTHQPGVHGK